MRTDSGMDLPARTHSGHRRLRLRGGAGGMTPALALLLSLQLTVSAQPAGREFDAVRIKPLAIEEMIRNRVPVQPSSIGPGRLHLSAVSLPGLMMQAFHLEEHRLKFPEWMARQAFVVDATFPSNSTRSEIEEMLRTTLVVQFRLKTHSETSSVPVYVLEPGRRGAKLPKSTLTNVEEGASIFIRSYSGTVRFESAPDGGQRAQLRGVSMEDIVKLLRTQLDRPVIDRTSASGRYDLSLTLTKDDLKAVARLHVPAAATPDAASAPFTSSLLKSIQAYGLQLVPRKEKVSVIVVDHMEKLPIEQ